MRTDETILTLQPDQGAEIKLVDYVRFQLGEGIEKEASDFAAEVAKTLKGA